MIESKKEILINHSAKNLYTIVLDIEKYPEFIPWCSSVIVHSNSKNKIIADLLVNYSFFKKKFTSQVKYNSNKMTIDVIYIDGPLRKLQTKWKFKETKKNYTKVFIFIKFEFKNIIYQKLS